jgi:hypothetical protein
MAAATTLEELVQYIRETLPQSKMITHLRLNEPAGVVTFSWQGRDFAVKKSLEVLEMKGNNLYVTGATMLMQSAFMKKDKYGKVLDAVVETIQRVEEMAKTNPDNAVSLLSSVKQTLKRLTGK